MTIKRIETGIIGFDGLIKGGFPIASTVLLTGSPGTGKTIFGLQYLYNGALKFREKGLYVTFEQTEDARRAGPLSSISPLRTGPLDWTA